jgi:hypothetical protein
MALFIDPKDQKTVNQLRLDLAQAIIYVADLKSHPENSDSRYAIDRACNGLCMVRRRLDRLGIRPDRTGGLVYGPQEAS